MRRWPSKTITSFRFYSPDHFASCRFEGRAGFAELAVAGGEMEPIGIGAILASSCSEILGR